MTKPKTTAQLLAEANKLAKERGMKLAITKGSRKWFHGMVYDGMNQYGLEISADYASTKAQSLRCLIAALREVPVKGRKR